MSETMSHFTYRVTNVPKSLTQDGLRSLFDEADQKAITKTSLGACPYRPATFSVATVTFKGLPTFGNEIVTSGSKPLKYDGDSMLVDDQFFGLTPLNSVSGTVKADLIAVTGLAGRAFESWQNRSGHMWLRDYLPLELRDCRIFVYGYPSKARRSQSEANIQDFTEGFVKEIVALRSESKKIQTPLILLGHSLGCVIIKQAIIESVSSNPNIFPLHRYICGIVFFGAPHRGLNNPELQELVQGTPPEGLVRDLKPNSSLLNSMNHSFPDACKDTKVISCYETEHTQTRQLEDPSNPNSKWVKTGPARFMVPPASACLYWSAERESRIAIHADHSEIAKLNDLPGSAYQDLKSQLTKLVDGASSLIEARNEIDLAGQDILGLFFIFQYECSFLRAWDYRRTGQSLPHNYLEDFYLKTVGPDLVPKVPYGHPAYLTTSELALLLELIGDLLEKHRMHSEKESEVAASSQRLLALSSRRTLPFSSKLEQEGVGTNNNHHEVVYKLDNWSASDRHQFNYLLQKFRAANEVLSQLSPYTNSVDLLASTRAMKNIAKGIGTLNKVQDISRIDQIYDSLCKRAMLKSEYEQGAPERNKNTLKYPISKIEMKAGAGSPHYRLLTVDATASQNFSTDSRWAFVEWRSYEQAHDLRSQRQAEEQALRLACELSITSKPPLLRTLTCAGFVQDVTEKQFSFLFELPDWVDITKAPTTLHSLLADKQLIPTFSQRIKLAQNLVFSVAELHVAGILHKGLHSGNVYFFHPRFADSIAIDRWFLGGFEASRPDEDNQLSIDPQKGIFDVYRHPELRDESNKMQGRPGSERRHDIYSLGLMLLEIGLWKRLDASGMQKQADSPANSAKRFFDIAQKFLPHAVGEKYCEAVLVCLDRTQQRLSKRKETVSTAQVTENATDDDERGGVSLQLFVEQVVQRLESCHCRE